MALRKKICVITICPEDDYQQRVLDGIFRQCAVYNYDVVVVSPLVQVANFYKDYLEGELNIYELINFDLFDGIIITPLPMTEDRVEAVTNHLLEKLKKECKKPVVSLDLAFGDYDTVFTDDKSAIQCVTEHLIEQHNCTELFLLTGMENYPISINRIEGFKNALKKHNIPWKKSNVFYGDFWYTSGEQLADRLISKELEMPDAVVCASDHMAIGLTNELMKHGIKVPDDLIVTGYEATREAVLNVPPITSYLADETRTAALAVEKLHKILEPKAKSNKSVIPAAGSANLCIGGTCGCKEDFSYTRDRIKHEQYSLDSYDEQEKWTKGIDIGMLLESYTSEILTSTDTPERCLQKIYESIYLMKPYGYFYLCLNENWLDSEKDKKVGYDENMHLVIYSDMAKKLHGYPNHVFFGPDRQKVFKSKQMLPALFRDEFEKPQVFYFAPVHFINASLGYIVLQNDLDLARKPGPVFRNYVRNINNALEMSRAKNRISNISEHDLMTNLYNRRGLERCADELLKHSEENKLFDSKWLAFVIDMDGLKMINDTFGHSEGDVGIVMIGEALRAMADGDEICVRGGGDEFYLLGLGNYSPEVAEEKKNRFMAKLEKLNEAKNTTLPIAASIGYAIAPAFSDNATGEDFFNSALTYDQVLDRADVQMYIDKRRKKSRR